MTPMQRSVLAWYVSNGRSNLPWRTRRDPYLTLVSEFMLQQTQVDRVIAKFNAFLIAFPDIFALASAERGSVIRLWSGLGYNSRAVRLHALAAHVVTTYAGVLPADEKSLRALPGVGPYTARAILAFGYDHDCCATDTNIARIIHRMMFGLEFPQRATPVKLDAIASELVPRGYGHDWNGALMDIGAGICTARSPNCEICPLRPWCVSAPVDAKALLAARKRVQTTRKPSKRFEHTKRFARGRIVDRLRLLPAGQAVSLLDLRAELAPVLHPDLLADLSVILENLKRDGLITIDAHMNLALV